MLQQPATMAGIFCCNYVNHREHTTCPGRHVIKISDRRSNNVQPAPRTALADDLVHRLIIIRFQFFSPIVSDVCAMTLTSCELRSEEHTSELQSRPHLV